MDEAMMKKLIYSAIFVMVPLSFFVFGQDSLPVETEMPKAMTKEEASELSEEDWKKRLTPAQYNILRQAGTERAHGKVYKEFKEQGSGTYHCAGCNTELFSSKEKFTSHCGWPSFYDPSKAENVITKEDHSAFMVRTEVLCAVCGGHLGHVFKGEGFDTPTDKRYCINGTGLKFVPDEVAEEAAEKAKDVQVEKENGE